MEKLLDGFKVAHGDCLGVPWLWTTGKAPRLLCKGGGRTGTARGAELGALPPTAPLPYTLTQRAQTSGAGWSHDSSFLHPRLANST